MARPATRARRPVGVSKFVEALEERRMMAATRAAAVDATASVVPPVTWDTHADTWVATDALGRAVPTAAQVGAPRDKQVGVFYFLWLGGQSTTVYDNTELLKANPTNPAFGPAGSFHHWGKPLFDYYRSDDRSVIRKHLQMLGDAGVDFISLDMTNNLTYGGTGQGRFDALTPILETIQDMQNKGLKTPRFTTLASNASATWMWNNIYSQNKFRSTWYEFDGKPLLMIKNTDATPAGYTASDAFTVRRSWAWKGAWWEEGANTGKDRWPWIQDDNSQFGWSVNNQTPEATAVAAASHPTNSIGRSYRPGFPQANYDATLGIRFTDQALATLKTDPEVVFITGWNEWVAQRTIATAPMPFAGGTIPAGGSFFVDGYDLEYSRDIEPGRTLGGDNYMYQMAAFIRKFRGARASVPAPVATQNIDGAFADWSGVENFFRDDIGDKVSRNSQGIVPATQYVNATGRNDIVEAKVATDDRNVYFYARTQANFSNAIFGGATWMTLYVDADQNPNTGWLGYDFVLNRARGASWSQLQRNVGNANVWADVTKVPMKYAGNQLEISVTRASLGLDADARGVDLKWADNVQTAAGDWTDFTLNGDAAPNDRYNYRANFGENSTALPAPWLSAEIGSQQSGTSDAQYAESITLTNRGTGIAGTSDQMRFAYQAVTGDVEIVTRVAELDRASDGSKAGLMIRQALGSTSKHVGIFATGFNGAGLYIRTGNGGGTASTGTTAHTPFRPQWLKLTREGGTIRVFKSPDGVTWTNVGGNQGVSFTGTFYVGVALGGQNIDVDAIARFDNTRITQPTDAAPTLASSAIDRETRQEAVLFFSDDVAASLDAGDVVVTNLLTGDVLPAAAYTVASNAPGTRTTGRVTFAAPLPDGRYQIRIAAGAIVDAAGRASTADIDVAFTSLAGDVNSDGTVGFGDLVTLAQNYGRDALTFSQGNVDRDTFGRVEFSDLVILAQNYGTTLAAAPPPMSLVAATDGRPAKTKTPRGRAVDVVG